MSGSIISTDTIMEVAEPYSVEISMHPVNVGSDCIRKTKIYSMRELVRLMWGTIKGKEGLH